MSKKTAKKVVLKKTAKKAVAKKAAPNNAGTKSTRQAHDNAVASVLKALS